MGSGKDRFESIPAVHKLNSPMAAFAGSGRSSIGNLENLTGCNRPEADLF